jgi:hypothetical protein
MFGRLWPSLAGLCVLACASAVVLATLVVTISVAPHLLALPPLIMFATGLITVLAIAIGYRFLRRAGFSLLSRTSDRYTFNLAAFHSPHGLTWSWIVAFILPRSPDEGRWLGAWTYSTNGGRQFGFQFMRCQLTFSRQRTMPYRDLWRRERDIRDGLIVA